MKKSICSVVLVSPLGGGATMERHGIGGALQAGLDIHVDNHCF